MWGLTTVLILTVSWTPTRSQGPIATLGPNQQLQGFASTLSTGEVVNIFYGIRYAEPPLDRFKKADSLADWTGLRNATTAGARCMQMGEDGESEDCLFLNIYTASLTGSQAVVVYFHGGGYASGSGSEFYYDGSVLAKKGVVVVTVNYRLSMFGFLSTEDDVLPGNYGMLDQIEALKWVQKNIAAFGGDPNNVTIFGQSAGGGIVSLLQLSPLSAGLYHRAIMDSGASLCDWAVSRASAVAQPRQVAEEMAKSLACPITDSYAIYSCLKDMDAKLLLATYFNMSLKWDSQILFQPVVETKYGFLPDYPEKLIEKGAFNKVSTLRGFNSGEYVFIIEDDENDGVTRAEFDALFDKSFDLYSPNADTKKNLLAFVRDKYLGSLNDPFAIREKLREAAADTMFALGVVTELQKLVTQEGSQEDHYLYQLDYQIWQDGVLQQLVPSWYGVIHSGDIFLVFHQDPTGFMGLFSDQEDSVMADRVQSLWTNFIKFGNPTATPVDNGGTDIIWEKYTASNPNMLKINLNSTLVPYPKPQIVSAYDRILDYYRGESPFPTQI